MIATIILVLVALLALLSLLWLARGRSLAAALEHPAEHIRAVDVDAFRNLVDPDEEEFLRTSLPPAEFRRIQRERLRAAVEYVSCAAQNAAILLRLPLGLFNPAGVTMGIDEAAPEALQIQTCDAEGCYAGAALTPDTPPNPDRMREIYTRHASRLLP